MKNEKRFSSASPKEYSAKAACKLLDLPLDKEVDPLAAGIQLWRSCNTPTSLGLYLCAKYGSIKELLTHTVDPLWYSDAHDFFVDHQCCKFLAKVQTDAFELSDRETDAEELFLSCEQKCKQENDFWVSVDCGRTTLHPAYAKVIMKARAIVADVLGSLSVDEWLDACRLGPGVVAYGPKAKEDYIKLTSSISYTETLEPYLVPFLNEYKGWSRTFDISQTLKVKGGKFATVPKDALKYRCIETQPTVNIFMQLGLGRIMRERILKVTGIDLRFDQARNADLAREGSLSGKYCTIDLRNASDTISRGIVRQLLPADWYHALNLVRTRQINFRKEDREVHRFSSMGNGATFELETLIFYSLTKAVMGPGKIAVYGDDIICPAKAYQRVVSALSLSGFEVNEKKSFHTGPFRESCGGDYFQGHNVRPYFLKEIPSNVPEIIRVANGLSRAASRLNRGYGFDGRFVDVRWFLLRHIDVRVRRWIAIGNPSDDSYLIGSHTKAGFKVIAKAKTKRPEKFNEAIAGMLYRLFKREALCRDLDSEILGLVGRLDGFPSAGRQATFGVSKDAVYKARLFDPFIFERTWGLQNPLAEIGWTSRF